MSSTDIYQFLDTHHIAYKRYDHPPVYTCDEANELCPEMPENAIKTKNLLLRDKKGKRHFLVTVSDDKSVDLKALKSLLKLSKIGFASPERLQKHLGLEPGSVTILGVINDSEKAVEVIIDQAVWQAEAIRCHPLVNTSTLVISQPNIRRFLELTGHTVRVLDILCRIPKERRRTS
jgi:Ala-tRNA(Pro) deacylase